MNRLFQASNAESLTETISSESPLRFLHSYQESLNVAFFVPNTGTTTVRYFILNSSYASLYLPGSDNESVKAVSLSNDYPDYTCLYSERMSEKTLAFSAVYQYQRRKSRYPPRLFHLRIFTGQQRSRLTAGFRMSTGH